MGSRTEFENSRPGFIADAASIALLSGRQVDWDEVPASYADDSGGKFLPAGTVVSEMPGGGLVPRVDGVEYAGDAVGLLRTSAHENDRNAALSGYGVVAGGVVYQNLLPDAEAGTWGTMATELQDAGPGFRFEVYEDDTLD
jgi:hypothetical protein